MNRGKIVECVVGSRRLRVLIISSDECNQAGIPPVGLVVTRGEGPKALAVTLQSGDPLPGAVVAVPLITRVDVSSTREDLGFVTNDTMNAVERELRMFLELP